MEALETVKLTDRQRQVYELVKLIGHSIKEASKILGISKSSVYYHLRRAVEKVERLEAEEKIRKLEERIEKIERELLQHIFEYHILKEFLER